MLLLGVTEDNGWLLSKWNLTYPVGWKHICKAIHSTYEFYAQAEVLVDTIPISIKNKYDILKLEEKANMTIRGISSIIKVPVMITFINQTNVVHVNVAQANHEFLEVDYQKFNMSLCQYMDSIELAMYI